MINIQRKSTPLSLALLMTVITAPICYAAETKNSAPVASSNEAKDSSTVIISRNGKALLTEQQFNDFINQISEAENRVKMALDLDPDRTRKDLYDAKERSIIIREYINDNKIRSTPEYVKEEQKMLEHIRDMLDYGKFIENHKIDVTDAEVKDYYDKNKETQMRMAPAGVRASGVQFETQALADVFAEKVRKAADMDMVKVAEEEKARVQNFGIVNKDAAHVDKEVREKVETIKQFPSVEVIKAGDKKFWVVKLLSRQDAEYFPFDQAQSHIKQMLVGEKTNKMLEEKIPAYKKQYGIEENKAFVEPLSRKKEEAEKKEREAMAATAEKK
jgi:hypothetical protein